MSFSLLGCCPTSAGSCFGSPSGAEIIIVDNGPANPYPSGLYASGSNPVVKINALTHPFPDDIDMLLVSPNGEVCMLMSDCGGGAHALVDVDLTIDGSSATEIPDVGPITTGTYKPTNKGALDDTLTGLTNPLSGYLVNNVGGYPAGVTSINVDTGTGTFVAGNVFAFSATLYTVVSFSGGTLTFTPALTSGVADNDPLNAAWPNQLSILSGTGIWKLYVLDDRSSDCGWIGSWQLVFGATTYGGAEAFDASDLCGWADPP